MAAFLIIGVLGVVLLVVALVVGDHLEGVLGGLDVGGGVVTTEALAGFLGVLGFGGAIAYDATGSTGLSILVGVVLGVVLGGLVGWVSHRLRSGDHSGAVRSSDLVERVGTVISDIPEDGYGVVSLTVGGHVTRLNARSSAAVPSGITVVVVGILSPTSVSVEPLFLP